MGQWVRQGPEQHEEDDADRPHVGGEVVHSSACIGLASAQNLRAQTQRNTRHGNTRHGKTRHGNTRHGNTRHDNKRHGSTRMVIRDELRKLASKDKLLDF